MVLWWRALGGGPGRAPQPQLPADPHACALPEITAPATRRDSSARPVCNAAHRSGHIDLRCRSLWGGVQIDQHALRLATIQPRDLTHASLHPARPGPSGERIGASRGSAPQPTGAGTLSERPAGREFGPALAERDEGSPASAGPMPLSAARMDTDGPLSAAAGRPPARSSNGSDGRPPGPRRHRRKAPRRA